MSETAIMFFQRKQYAACDQWTVNKVLHRFNNTTALIDNVNESIEFLT